MHQRYSRRASTARTYPPGVSRVADRYRVMVSYQDRDHHLLMTRHYADACRYAAWSRKILGQKYVALTTTPEQGEQAPVWLCLLTWRKVRGMTQYRLSKRSGLHQANYSRYEGDERAPSVETLRRIAECLGLTLGQLLGQEAAPKVVVQGERTRGSRPCPEFGARLAELRTRAGLEQQALADRAEMPIRILRRLERGEYGASFSIAVRLAAALGVPTDALAQPPQPAELALA